MSTPRSGEIRVGISACLLGEKVRHDGGHKRDHYVNETIARFVSFVPVCPEVDIGLGVPRETLRLVRSDDGPRMVAQKSGKDHTSTMRRYARAKARELAKQDLSGFLLKKNSPSCGVFRVRLYDRNGVPSKNGRGLFAEELMRANPLLPVEEEGRLQDPRLRESFFERVFAYRRLKDLFHGRWRMGDLVRFHTAEKLLLRAHDEKAYGELGRLVAEGKELPRPELAGRYQERFMQALGKRATTRRHANVLQHALGFFKRSLDTHDRAELRDVIEDYRRGLIPLVVPITLIGHHVRREGVEYLAGQTYLNPHPKELMLRNHA